MSYIQHRKWYSKEETGFYQTDRNINIINNLF